MSSVPETIYESKWFPEPPTRAEDVLTFLLVPESAFHGPNDCVHTRLLVRQVLGEAKREVLLQWYASQRGKDGAP